MKLGEMLVRDGRITPVQLQGAIAHQAQAGGRIGSILVELGFLDAETLTVYLGLELGMPIATGATLERCKRSAVRLLSPQQAARYRCVPIVIQGQTLILAIEDPLDMPTLDALHNMTGYRVLPRVAPEIRIHYYLERFYGVPRPQRFVALGDSPRGNPAIGSHTGGLPGPPLPGLPPRRTAPIAAPTPRPTLQRSPPPPGVRPPPVPSSPQPVAAPPPPMPGPAAIEPGLPSGSSAMDTLPDPEPPETERAALPVVPLPPPPTKEEQEALEIDANDLVDELDADEAALAAHAGEAGADPGRRTAPLRAQSDDEETEPGDDGSDAPAGRTWRRGRWRDTIEEADREGRGEGARADVDPVEAEAAGSAASPDADATPSEIQDPITRPVAGKGRARTRGRDAIGRPGSVDDDRDTERAVHPVLSLDAALAVMASTDQRGAIADAILGFAARLFEVAALCLVRDHMALGWKGFGPGIDDDRIEALLIPLEMSSIYQLSVRSRDLFRGHAFPAALHDHVFKVLRCQAPLYSMVVPISIGPRVVNLLYCHKRDGGDLTEDEEVALRQVAAAAGEAYVRLISASKAQRKSA